MAASSQRGAPAAGRFRIAAAALAGAPIGFAVGAFLAARRFIAYPEAGAIVLAGGLVGALLAAALMALAAIRLPPKQMRIGTLAAGGASFAILAYMVQDYVGERLERSRAFDAAYERMPAFELTLLAEDLRREPFAELAYGAVQGDYVALRPRGWRCRGSGRRQDAMAIYTALQTVTATEEGRCAVDAVWRIDGEAGEACIDDGHALLDAADAMVNETERKSSCRQTED
jgi:hypothetical protein